MYVLLHGKKNKNRYYAVTHKESYSIIDVAKLFNTKIKFLPSRLGERYASALTNVSYSNKVHKYFGKIKLKDYINRIVRN